MSMFGHLGRLGSTALMTTAIAVGVTSPAALASPGAAQARHPATITWTVTPGGAFTGQSGTAIFTDTTSGNSVTCTSSNMKGTLKSGSGLAGKGLGIITSLIFVNCSFDGITVSMSSGPAKWSLNAVSYKSGVTSGTITGIHFTIASSTCNAVVDGTSDTAHNGKIKITFTNSNDHLRLQPGGGNLHLYDATCLGVINDGDSGQLAACTKPVPKQAIVGSGGGDRPAMIGPPCKKG